MLMTLLLKGSGSARRGRTFTGAWQQVLLDVLPATTNDSYGYQNQWELKPGSLIALQVHHLNHGATAALLDTKRRKYYYHQLHQLFIMTKFSGRIQLQFW